MVDHFHTEHIPVVPHSRRQARATQRKSVRSRLAGIGGVGIALGVTAAVVMAPMANAGTAPAKVASVAPAHTVTVSAVTAPAVEVDLSVAVPTVTKNEPPPAPKPQTTSKSSTKSGSKTASKTSSESGSHEGKDCVDKSHGGESSGGDWKGWKNKG